MLERRAGRGAVVLEDDDVAEPLIALQVLHALAERPTAPAPPPRRSIVASVSSWRGDSMITSCAPMPFILSNSPSPCRSSAPFDAQHRELVRDHAQVPAGRIGPAAVAAVRQQLARRHLLVPLAERTRAVRRDCTDSSRKSVGRLRRSVEMITQRPVTGSLRSSDIMQSMAGGIGRLRRTARTYAVNACGYTSIRGGSPSKSIVDHVETARAVVQLVPRQDSRPPSAQSAAASSR